MKIKLVDNREVEIIELNQSLHYKTGISTGYPDEDFNDFFLEDLEEEYAKKCATILIPPKRYSKAEIEKQNNTKYSDDVDIELLPSVLYVASFKSNEPTKSTKGDFSLLIVIWFQDEYAFAIDKEIQEKLINIPWDTKAKNFSFEDY